MRLSVLDQSPIPDGSTPAQALHNTVAGGPDQRGGRRHRAHPRGQRRRDASALPPPEKALAYLETRQRPDAGSGGRRAVVGSPTTVRAGLEAVAKEYGTDELMLLTITYEHEARRRSYELIAEEFGLVRPPVPVSATRP